MELKKYVSAQTNKGFVAGVRLGRDGNYLSVDVREASDKSLIGKTMDVHIDNVYAFNMRVVD
jgi:hypothetical protein